eukprot:gene11321-12507_t
MISIEKAGGYDQLLYKELGDGEFTKGANFNFEKNPVYEDDSVVIDTFACGVNYADVIIRWGLYSSAKEYVGWPITPGFEFSGEVVSIGKNVSKFKVGDRVFGISLFGGYSKRIMVPEVQLRHVPEAMDNLQAAGFLTVALTAWYAMFECCKLRKGDKILVHSAAGGVGSMLVQMGKIAGCHVTGVVGRTSKVEYLQSIGCDVIIDKSQTDLWTSVGESCDGGKFTAIFDANGVETFDESYKHVEAGGRLVVYGAHTLLPKSDASSQGNITAWNWLKIGLKLFQVPKFNPLKLTEENKAVMGFNLSFMINKIQILDEALADLLNWVNEGRLKVAKVTGYPLSQAGKAHEDLESGKTVGKLVLITKEET